MWEFCTLKSHKPDGAAHGMDYHENGRFYSTRFRETLWNGIPAYLKYVRDVTEEVKAQKEKEHIEQYFQTLVRKLPGGVAVVRIEKDGRKTPGVIFRRLCHAERYVNGPGVEIIR